MKKPRKIRVTALDIKALRAIQECGFIGLDAHGETFLESSQNVGRWRLKRLIEQKLVTSNMDMLLQGRGIPPQSYSLSRRGVEVAGA